LPCCEQEIEIPIPKQEPKYVINCLFQPFTIPYPQNTTVSLKQTIGFLDSLDFPTIDNAIVKMFYEDSLILNLNYDDNSRVYVNAQISNFQPGSYHLQVEHNGEFIDAYDSLPKKVNLKKVTILPFAGRNELDNSYSKINFIFDDPGNEVNYYEISVTYLSITEPFGLFTDFPSIISEPYYPSVLSIDQEDPVALPFTDKSFNGNEVSIPIYYLHPLYAKNDKVEPHTITLHFRTISKNYYNYKVSLLKQGYNIQADIIYGQAESINVFTNIPLNYGVYAGYQTVDQTFDIRNNDFIEYEY